MICKKILIYLKINKAKQTFANLPILRCIQEGLFRLYTSWKTVWKNRKTSLEITRKYGIRLFKNISSWSFF